VELERGAAFYGAQTMFPNMIIPPQKPTQSMTGREWVIVLAVCAAIFTITPLVGIWLFGMV
jgi:hypothetical protein